MGNPEVLVRDEILMALVPPIGYRSEWGSLLAFLKLARGAELDLECTELEFFDAGGCTLERRQDAFGLRVGMHLSGPYSEKLGDDSRRPERAVLARWRLNEFAVETELVVPEDEESFPRVVYLPLQVPLPTDEHIIVSIVNRGLEPIDIAEGMREAVLWVDGTPYASVAARLWNGGYLVRPNRATTRRFRLSDFPGAPRQGAHETSLEILGARSLPQVVEWRGEAWTEPIPRW